MLAALKRVQRTGANLKKVPKSPLQDLNYQHEDENGVTWEQGY